MRKPITLLLLSACLLPGLAHAEMYRWVDQNGVTHYGDRVPPKTAKQRREVINEQGHIVSVREREATTEERAAIAAREREKLAAEAATARQAQYDLSLTATYNSVTQLDAAYENRLAIIDGKIKSVNKTRVDIEAVLEPLYERAAGKNAEAGLDKRIKQTEKRLREQKAVIARLEADRNEIISRHDTDRERFLALTGAR